MRNISDALGDPTIFTNALDNQYLPFVVNGDTMSNEEIDNMEIFWSNIQGGTNLGNYAYMFKVGIFADEYAELRTIWSKKGGKRCYELGHGIFDPANAQAVHDGCVKGGVKGGGNCYELGHGIFDPANAQAVHDGCVKGGENCYKLGHGIFDPANAQVVHDGSVKGGNTTRDKKAGKVGVWWRRLPLFQEFMKMVSANYFTWN